MAVLLGAAVAIFAMLLLRRPTAHPPARADVIVVLQGDAERAAYAEELLRQGVAPRILSTLYDPGCVRAGNPPSSCQSRVRNTVDEALLMGRTLPSERVRRVLVVTSNFHRLRAAAVFEVAFLGTGTRVQVVAAPGPTPSWSSVAHEAWSFLPSVAVAIAGRIALRI